MRRIRYSVAMSLDGCIAGPKGEADWIVMDPEIDFRELFSQFDTMLVGRGTYEAALKQGGGIPLVPPPGKSAKLKLTSHRLYKKTGTLSLEYAVK